MVFQLGARLKIALDAIGIEQRVDTRDIIETVVDTEAHVRRKFQIDLMRQLAAQKFLVAIERGQDLGLVRAAERHNVDRSQLKVGAHLDARHRDDVMLEHWVGDLSAGKELGGGVPDQLSDAQHALRGSSAYLVVGAGHDVEIVTLFRVASRGPL